MFSCGMDTRLPGFSNQPQWTQGEILFILKILLILLILYHWTKARTSQYCSTFQLFQIASVGRFWIGCTNPSSSGCFSCFWTVTRLCHLTNLYNTKIPLLLSTESTKKHGRENGILFRVFRVFRGPSLLYSCRFVCIRGSRFRLRPAMLRKSSPARRAPLRNTAWPHEKSPGFLPYARQRADSIGCCHKNLSLSGCLSSSAEIFLVVVIFEVIPSQQSAIYYSHMILSLKKVG